MLDYPQGFVSSAVASETAVLHQTLPKMLQENVWQGSEKLCYSSRERVKIPKADPSEYLCDTMASCAGYSHIRFKHDHPARNNTALWRIRNIIACLCPFAISQNEVFCCPCAIECSSTSTWQGTFWKHPGVSSLCTAMNPEWMNLLKETKIVKWMPFKNGIIMLQNSN